MSGTSEDRSSPLRADLVAGIGLAAFAIPESMAYAGLAGLPPQAGLYCYLVAGPLFALLTSSRHLAVGPTSAISVMVAAALAVPAGGDPLRYGQLAARVRDGSPRPRRVVLDLSLSTRFDLATVNMLGELDQQLRLLNVELRLAEVHGQALERLSAKGVADRFSGVQRRLPVAALVGDGVAAGSANGRERL